MANWQSVRHQPLVSAAEKIAEYLVCRNDRSAKSDVIAGIQQNILQTATNRYKPRPSHSRNKCVLSTCKGTDGRRLVSGSEAIKKAFARSPWPTTRHLVVFQGRARHKQRQWQRSPLNAESSATSTADCATGFENRSATWAGLAHSG
jgi:hypothetical protein